MGNPARFQSGLSTARNGPLVNYGLPDPTGWHTFFDDFDKLVVADWTITTTEAGAGSATEVISDADGGVLLITNDAADDDNDFFQKIGEGFLMEAGKKAVFKARMKVSDATQSDFVIGLQITDTSPLDVTDGIYFRKDDGDAFLDVVVRKNATTGSVTSTAVHTVVSDTWMDLGWFYDGKDSVSFYVNGNKVATLSASAAYLPDTELTPSFGLQNGEAVAKTMSLDFLFVSKQRA